MPRRRGEDPRRGVGPFARRGDARRNELRAVFALFDVEGRGGAISLADVRNAVKRGGSGLSEADAGDWPKLAEALEAKIGSIKSGHLSRQYGARGSWKGAAAGRRGGNAIYMYVQSRIVALQNWFVVLCIGVG